MISFTKLLPVILFVFLQTSVSGQFYFRLEAKVTIKNKEKDGQGSLMTGRLYYDINRKQLVYDLNFPEREVWVVQDTLSRVYRNNALVKTEFINPFAETTVFHKALEGTLTDYGLKNSIYKIDKIERDQGLVITTWLPTAQRDKLGPILTATRNNLLEGVVFKTPQGDVFNQQIYQNYVTVSGLRIPTEIIQVISSDGQEIYQVVNLSEIIVNNTSNDKMYYYPGSSK